MAHVTYYVVLVFDRSDKGRLRPRDPIAPQSKAGARRLACRLSQEAAGVLAFSRTGNIDMGDWQDAVIIYRKGDLPEDLGLPDHEPWEEEGCLSEIA
ncbi:hypothetical protein V5F77_20315 [Xanthobacter sp. DSM 24535]|uniref:hypothetical protein n=1 Tax=Roseixanthobacter psychrophilus TaxID=3119917 RepID=UPI003729F88A